MDGRGLVVSGRLHVVLLLLLLLLVGLLLVILLLGRRSLLRVALLAGFLCCATKSVTIELASTRNGLYVINHTSGSANLKQRLELAHLLDYASMMAYLTEPHHQAAFAPDARRVQPKGLEVNIPGESIFVIRSVVGHDLRCRRGGGVELCFPFVFGVTARVEMEERGETWREGGEKVGAGGGLVGNGQFLRQSPRSL